MEINNRKAIFDKISKYDYLENNKEKIIEITEWSNGEGWDISIDNKIFTLTRGELEAIDFLTRALDHNDCL